MNLKIKPTLTWAFKPVHIGQFSIGHTKREQIEPSLDSAGDRDGDVYTISAGYMHPFLKGKGMVNLSYELSRDITEGRNWDNTGNRISLTTLIPLWKKFSLLVMGDLFIQDYKHHQLVIDFENNILFEKRREDTTYLALIMLKWELWKGLALNLSYTYTRDDSNISTNDYERNIYSMGLAYVF